MRVCRLVLADTFAILIVACYFGEYQFLLLAPEKVSRPSQSHTLTHTRSS